MIRNADCSLCPLGDFVRSTHGHVCIVGVPVEPRQAVPGIGPSLADGGPSESASAPLRETGGSPTLADRGRESALMIVGQNPGSQENREGVPFVGLSGKLIRGIMDESNFPYLLTNAVKCHSEKNREPVKEEIEACRPYLIAELLEYRPLVVLALGNPALKALTGKSGVTNYRGKPEELRPDIRTALAKSGWTENLPKVLCSVHPAYVARVPNAKGLLVEDCVGAVRLVKQLLGEELAPDADWIDATCDDIDFSRPITFDIESTGTNYRAKDFRLHLIGVDDGNGPVKILMGESNFQQFVEKFPEAATTFNGLAYDEPALRWLYKNSPRTVQDAMLLAFILDETMPHHTLEACAIRRLGVTPWKDNRPRTKAAKAQASEKWALGPQTPEEWAELKQYNARDVRWTRQLWDIQWGLLTPAERRLYTYLMVPAVKSLKRMEETGVYISRENMAEARVEAEAQIARTLAVIQQHAEDNWLLNFNPNSTRHVRKLLYDADKLALKVIRKTPGGDPSTDQETLKILAQDEKAFEVCHALLDYREATKIKSSYLDRYDGLIEEDGRLHPPYSVIDTETGRTSSWIQQIPRKKSVRRIVEAPPGRKLVVADQSQIELRLMAWRSRDPEMLATYKDGKYGADLHTRTGTAILDMQQKAKGLPPIPFDGKGVHKPERTLSKGVNFGCQYGAEAWTLKAYLFKEFGLKVTFKEAEFLRDEIFFGTFRGLPPYYDALIQQVKKDKCIYSSFGRRRQLLNIDAGDIELRAEAARQAINSPNQADASDITLIGLNLALEMAPWLDPVMFVHDSNMFEVNEDRAEEAAAILVECMQYKALDYIESKFGITIDVPLVAEAEILSEWQ